MARCCESDENARNARNTKSTFYGDRQHQDTPDNNETTFFDFTDENYKRVEKIMAKYPANYRQASIIPLLDLAQRQASEASKERGE